MGDVHIVNTSRGYGVYVVVSTCRPTLHPYPIPDLNRWPFDLRVNTRIIINCICIKFGFDNLSHLPVRARQTDRQTDATHHRTHASATAGYYSLLDCVKRPPEVTAVDSVGHRAA